jgi:hypothetical protein
LVDNHLKIKHSKTVEKVKNSRPRKPLPCPCNYYALNFGNMTDENLLRYCKTNNIPLNETNNGSSLIIQRIPYIQLSIFTDIPLEGVKCLNVNESFDDLMVLI